MNFPVPCRSCGHPELNCLLDLGNQPLANGLLRAEDLNKTEPRVPLRLALCEGCKLLQLIDLVPPDSLFTYYHYFSSFSDAMLRHAADAANRYVKEFGLGPDSFVVEAASNDGYLLKNFVKAGVPCLGVEPAQNIAAAAEAAGVPTLCQFFTKANAANLAQSRSGADLILGNNVFAHAPDINDFIGGLQALLKPDGRIVLEFPYGCEMIEKNEFDTIYHEHVFYFTLLALIPAFARHNLEIFHVEHLAIHGGSLRLFAGHRGAHEIRESVTQLKAEETEKGVDGIDYYVGFSSRVEGLKVDLVKLLGDLKSQGKRIAAYGASAKGSTLLNYYGIGADTLDFVADRSTQKQGLFTPGTHLPIVSGDELANKQPDYALLLTWNFSTEIIGQQQAFRDAGGKFIIPIPEVTLA